MQTYYILLLVILYSIIELPVEVSACVENKTISITLWCLCGLFRMLHFTLSTAEAKGCGNKGSVVKSVEDKVEC